MTAIWPWTVRSTVCWRWTYVVLPTYVQSGAKKDGEKCDRRQLFWNVRDTVCTPTDMENQTSFPTGMPYGTSSSALYSTVQYLDIEF